VEGGGRVMMVVACALRRCYMRGREREEREREKERERERKRERE
jgi:hypothetical protein